MHFEVPGVPEFSPVAGKLPSLLLPREGANQSCITARLAPLCKRLSVLSQPWAPFAFRKRAGNTAVQIGYQRSFWFRFPQTHSEPSPLAPAFYPPQDVHFLPCIYQVSSLCSLTTSTHPAAPLPRGGSIRPTFPLLLKRMRMSLGD